MDARGAAGSGGSGGRGIAFCLLVLVSLFVASEALPALAGGEEGARKISLDLKSLPAWAKDLLKLTPMAPEPTTSAPSAKFPLVLAANRTRRPDVLDNFRMYGGGWNITNKHYWVSVAFTGAAGFVLSALWFVSFGLVLGVHLCCRRGMGTKEGGSFCARRICLALLMLFTCAAATGCILLSVGQNEFHEEVLDTLKFVVNQSDFTIQILRNVTDFLSSAKTINVAEVYLPPEIWNEIDKLNGELNGAASILSEKTNESSEKIRAVIDDLRCILIVVASLMLLLAILGFLLSVWGHKHAIYVFIMSGWLLVAVTFILYGFFVILNNAAADTCTAMDEWVRYPQAETALSNILPCVDEQTTKHTLYQSKEVVRLLVNMVNIAVFAIANSNAAFQNVFNFYNQSGQPMPSLCSPYDSQLNDRQCEPQEVSITDAPVVWQNYTCEVSVSGLCISSGRITPDIYFHLSEAVNASYALYHYTPLLLSLQDCRFVRETFDTITTNYCPNLEHDLRMVSVGLALISIGVLLCLILWIFYANRPQREEVFAPLSEVKFAPNSNISVRIDVSS
ncbi:uncharacterized protein [Elaeis guineensis]|uniref:Uncharacterized protein LOC105041160 n=1 Tax=Elaeis guineensis var. tenera TaxID=51953 RepID=A0A6I9R1A9_ELAGV|nr:uncharacterized protein LOC105041160 [Elaeis guineensis]